MTSFLDQEYPLTQVIFCLDSEQDPALPVAERLRAERPSRDVSVVVSGRRIGCNPKINNLANAYPLVKHGLILISDSDVRVAPDFLARTARAFDDPRVGLASAFYRTPATGGLIATLEALAINAQYLPQALTAGAFGMRFTMGAAVLVRKDVFDRTGGFANLADHIADDYNLGEAVRKEGFLVEFSEAVVETLPGSRDFGAHLRHQIRESRVIRLCQPAGYFGLFLLHSLSLLTLAALWAPSRLILWAFAAVWAVRAAAVALVARQVGGRAELLSLALLPVSDWVAFASWILGFGSNRVLWRGVVYSIQANGKLTPIRPSLEVPAA